MTRQTVRAPEPAAELGARLDRWVALELITAEQAERILAEERAHPTGAPDQPRMASLVGEALGYVGGILVLVAAGIIAARYWSELGVAGRLSVAFGAAAVLLVAGAAVRPRLSGGGRRLRSVCWLFSTSAVAAGLGLLGADVLDLSGDDVALLVGAGTAGYAAVLWLLHREVLQQAALLFALAATAGSAAARLPVADETVIGLAVWGVGAAWLLLGWGRVVGPRHASYVIGGAVTIVGAQLTVSVGWGAAVGLASAAVLVAAGAWMRDLVLLGVGAVATFLTVPAVLDLFFPDTLVAPFALLVAGVLLVAGALYATKRRRISSGPAPVSGSPRLAAGLAAGLAAAVVAAVVALGLG